MSHTFKPFKPSNGSRPMEFQGAVPIVGQPFVIKGGFPTVNVQCTCDMREAVLLVGSLPAQCPACGRTFQISTFTFNAQMGRLEVNLNVANAHTAPAVEPA